MNKAVNNFFNKKTRLIATVLGITLAVSGLHHGFFEMLQGNKPTKNLIIQSIGLEYQRWNNGDEAFTIIPNFLVTGISAISVSLVIIVWSIFRLEKPYGRTVFLLLFILLTLVGGGLGFTVFFFTLWGYATRMNRPLTWWSKILPGFIRRILSRLWGIFLVMTSAFFIIALEISVFGIPGLSDDTILTFCWSFLFSSLFLMNFTFFAGFSYDIENRSTLPELINHKDKKR